MISLREGPQRIQDTWQGSMTRRASQRERRAKALNVVDSSMFPGNKGEATAVGIILGVWFGAVEDSIREVDTNN